MKRPLRRRALSAGKNHIWLALGVVALLAAVVKGQGVKCFACNDKHMCPNISRIFDGQDDKLLYERDEHETFQACQNSPFPFGNKACKVCTDIDDIMISCTDDVEQLEVEGNGDQIEDLSETSCPGDQQQTNGGGYVLILTFVSVVLAVLVALGICYIWKKRSHRC